MKTSHFIEFYRLENNQLRSVKTEYFETRKKAESAWENYFPDQKNHEIELFTDNISQDFKCIDQETFDEITYSE